MRAGAGIVPRWYSYSAPERTSSGNMKKAYRGIWYKKRASAFDVCGYFYDIKLLSLLYFRAIHDDSIEEFLLASNVENIDLFGDICFKVKLRGYCNPVALFIKTEYRLYSQHNPYRIDFVECFKSYLKIRQRFDCDPSNRDPMFRGTFDETDCLFVIYTPAKVDTENSYTWETNSLFDKLNKLLDTRGNVKQVDNDVNIETITEIIEKEQITALAVRIAWFISKNKNFQMMLVDEIVIRYHVILAQKVFDVSDIQTLEESKDAPPYRIASFRQDFFDNNDEYIMLFRDKLYSEIIELRNDDDLKCSRSIHNKVVDLDVIEILSSLKFKVPAAFGNKDLSLRGSDARIERRICYLVSKIKDLLDKCESSEIVTIDEFLEDGLLKLHGGIAGAIGNIFVLDDNTKLMKITDNCETLGTHAKRLYTKLNSVIHKLHEYKFSIKVNKFPKLNFEPSYYEENIARDFFNKLLFYSDQAPDFSLEYILKREIEEIQCNQPNSFQFNSDVIFWIYQDSILKWWMQTKFASYLTQRINFFRRSIDNMIKDPMMTSINLTYYRSKIQQHEYTFTEEAVRSLNLPNKPSSTIIIAENCVLTVVKLLQYLKKKQKQHVVLDLEYIASLPRNDFNVLRNELKLFQYDPTIKKKVLILVCNKIESRDEIKTLEISADVLENITVIIITIENSNKILNEHFPRIKNIIHDKKCNLIDMCEESQQSIFETASAAFPGVEIRLDHLLRGWPKAEPKSAGAAVVADKGTATGTRSVEDEE